MTNEAILAAIEAELREVWINFHTDAAQRAACEMLERLKKAAERA